jgi:hypothetical protein
MHLVSSNTLLTWDDLSAALRDCPLWAGEMVEIEHARLGVKQHVSQPARASYS